MTLQHQGDKANVQPTPEQQRPSGIAEERAFDILARVHDAIAAMPSADELEEFFKQEDTASIRWIVKRSAEEMLALAAVELMRKRLPEEPSIDEDVNGERWTQFRTARDNMEDELESLVLKPWPLSLGGRTPEQLAANCAVIAVEQYLQWNPPREPRFYESHSSAREVPRTEILEWMRSLKCFRDAIV